MFEITFEANQTFGLTASEIGQTKAKLVRPKTYFYQSTGYNYEKSISIHKLGCLTDFETSQTEVTLASHCLTDWPYFEHCSITGI